MAAVIAAERASRGADDALARIAAAGFEVAGTPYEAFVRTYFASGRS